MAFDIIGKIAILPEKNKAQAKTLLKKYKHLRAVYLKSKIAGRLRAPRLKWLAGEKITETIYKENGCILKLDVKTCYFSPRLSSDRMEIARKVKKGEKVLVMFSGVAPYGIAIAKHSKAKDVYCVELSRVASKYALDNVRLNKLNNVKIIQGDVKRIIPKLKIKFDRIVMARPQLKYDFLKEAFAAAKRGTIIHFYDFIDAKNFPKESVDKIMKLKRKVKIISARKIREIAPYRNHVRIDFKIL
jgi:tRNA (guanine37-N1)-methyltransferase